MLVLPFAGIYEVRVWNGFGWHGKCIKFRDYRLRHLSNIMFITVTNWEAVRLVLLMEDISEVRNWNGFMWRDMRTKFHEDWSRPSSNIMVLLKKF
jgi:hypothetical protein